MKEQWRVPVVCIIAGVLLTVHRFQANPSFYDSHFARRFALVPINELYRYLYSFGATFVLLGLLPAILACILWNERPSEWGLTLGKNKLAGLSVALGLFVATIPILSYAAGIPELAAGHPMSRLAHTHRNAFLAYQAFSLLSIAGFELLFRGFLLFGLKKQVGEAAVYIQMLPYALLHFGRPQAEAFASIPAAIALGYLASRTGSVWYGTLLHWLCALTLGLFVCRFF